MCNTSSGSGFEEITSTPFFSDVYQFPFPKTKKPENQNAANSVQFPGSICVSVIILFHNLFYWKVISVSFWKLHLKISFCIRITHSTCLEATKKMPLEPGGALTVGYISKTIACHIGFFCVIVSIFCCAIQVNCKQ